VIPIREPGERVRVVEAGRENDGVAVPASPPPSPVAGEGVASESVRVVHTGSGVAGD